MSLKLLKDCDLGSAGDVVNVDDEAVANTLISLGVAEAAEAPAEPSTEAVEKAFIEKNEKALEAKAKAISNDFAAQMKSLRETVELQKQEMERLRLKAPAPDLGDIGGAKAKDRRFGFKSLSDWMGSYIFEQLDNDDCKKRMKNYRAARAAYGHMSKKAATLNATDDSGLLPPDFQDLYEPTFGSPFLYKEATLWATDSGSTRVPYIKDLDHTANIAGITTTDLDPDSDAGTAIEESKLTNGTKLVELKLFAELCPISEHMLRWSPYNMGTYTADWMKRAAEFKLEDWFNNHASFGWRTSTATNPTLNKVTRKTANRIVHTDILNMKAAAYDPFNPNYEGFYWVITAANKSRELGRLTFIDASGTYPIFLGNNSSVNNAEYPSPQTLEGIPIICSEFASALGSEGDIALIRPKSYWSVRNRNTDFDIEESLHFKFNKGGKVLRLIGEGAFSANSSGKTKLKSGDFVSPFVVLDDVVTS